MIAEANCPARFWLGPELIVAFKDPQHVEKILASSKFSHKHDIYEFLKCFLGEGLITSSGPKYKPHKKVLQPIFNLNFSKDCVPVFEKHIKTCVEHLDVCVGSDHFNIGHFIHSCTADIIGGTRSVKLCNYDVFKFQRFYLVIASRLSKNRAAST
jgi:cytochrome P450 family 4